MAVTTIEYLRPATGYRTGQTRNVSPKEAEILVNLGIAKIHGDAGETTKPNKRKYNRKDLRAQD